MVIALPPDPPAVKAIVKVPFEGVTEVIDGARGVLNGVPESWFEAVPAPTEFTALILTLYEVPFVSPVIRIGEVLSAGESAV